MTESYYGKFLRTKDFYNWIKDSSGKNSPTQFYYFNVTFSLYKNGKFINEKSTLIEKFRYCIQNIKFPSINFSAYDASGKDKSSSTLDASNMYGTYTIFGNSYLGIEQKTISMQILNTQSPIIENFIYPWMIDCLSQNSQYEYPFPRLNMTVKFYKANDMIQGDMTDSKPQFVYYIKGLFPLKINAYSPNHSVKTGDNNRQVQFSFNQFFMLPNAQVAKKFKLDHLFNGTRTENAAKTQLLRTFKNAVGNAAAAVVGNLVQKTVSKLDKTTSYNNSIQTADPVFQKTLNNSTTSSSSVFSSNSSSVADGSVQNIDQAITQYQKTQTNEGDIIEPENQLNAALSNEKIVESDVTFSVEKTTKQELNKIKNITTIVKTSHKAVIKDVSDKIVNNSSIENQNINNKKTLDLSNNINWLNISKTDATTIQKQNQNEIKNLSKAAIQNYAKTTGQSIDSVMQGYNQLNDAQKTNFSVFINQFYTAKSFNILQQKQIDSIF